MHGVKPCLVNRVHGSLMVVDGTSMPLFPMCIEPSQDFILRVQLTLGNEKILNKSIYMSNEICSVAVAIGMDMVYIYN